jgi:hypothetical protein
MNGEAENTRMPHPSGEQRGLLGDALIQTAQDLKQIGIGALGGWGAAKLSQPKQPPKVSCA